MGASGVIERARVRDSDDAITYERASSPSAAVSSVGTALHQGLAHQIVPASCMRTADLDRRCFVRVYMLHVVSTGLSLVVLAA